MKRSIALSLILTLSLLLFGNSMSQAQNNAAVQQPIQAGHTRDIIEVKWSPDDRFLISYSAGDGYIKLWELANGRLLWTADTAFIQKMDEHYSLTEFAWNPKQNLIASGSGNGTIQIWDAPTGKLRWRADAHAANVSLVACSADGKLVVSAGANDDEENELKIWDAATGQLVRQFKGKPGVVIAVSFNADGSKMKTGNLAGEVAEWEVATGRRLNIRETKPCGEAKAWPRKIVFSPDISLLAARCGDLAIVRETATGKIIRSVQLSVDFTHTVAFSGDGRVIAANDSGNFTVVNLATGEIKVVDEFNIGHTIDLNRDGSLLAEGGGYGDATVKITEVKTGKTYRRLEGHPGIVRALAFSPDGKALASGSGDSIIRLWETRTGSFLLSLAGHRRSVNALAFSSDGNTLVSTSQDETLRVWDVKSRRLRQTIESKDGIWGIEALAFNPDGTRLVTTSDSPQIKLWNTANWQVIRIFRTHEKHQEGEISYCCGSKALSVTFSPDGKFILSGHDDGTIKIWSPQQDQPLRIINTNARSVRAYYSPDGKTILSGSGDDETKALKFWDARTFQLLREVKDPSLDYLDAISISPDGKTFVTSTSGNEIRLWDSPSGKLIRDYSRGYSDDDAVAFSPDGKLIATGGNNQNIIVWEVGSGRLLWRLLALDIEHERMIGEKAKQFAALKAAREEHIRQANDEIAKWQGKVSLTFEHFGEPIDPLNLRMAEMSKIHEKKEQPRETATGVWLRFRNDSPLPITFRTASFYLGPGQKCGYTASNGKFYVGLCDGQEVSISYGIEDANGQPIPYGLDVGAISMLPPGTSVVFSGDRAHLADGQSIRIAFKYQKETEKRKLEDYGTEQSLYFKGSDLPRHISKDARNKWIWYTDVQRAGFNRALKICFRSA